MSNFIPLQQAIDMTTLYRKEMGEILAEPFKEKNVLAICETFEKADIEKMLSKPGCEKLRVYYGMDENLSVHALLVAVNSNNEDMLTTIKSDNSTSDEDVLDNALRCPPMCPPASPLNS
jgi:hypothetical protein